MGSPCHGLCIIHVLFLVNLISFLLQGRRGPETSTGIRSIYWDDVESKEPFP